MKRHGEITIFDLLVVVCVIAVGALIYNMEDGKVNINFDLPLFSGGDKTAKKTEPVKSPFSVGDLVMSEKNSKVYSVVPITLKGGGEELGVVEHPATVGQEIVVPIRLFRDRFVVVGNKDKTKNTAPFVNDKNGNRVYSGDVVFFESNGTLYQAIQKEVPMEKEIFFVPFGKEIDTQVAIPLDAVRNKFILIKTNEANQ